MPVNAGEARQLVLDSNQVLKRAEGYRHQAELSPQVKVSHVSFDQAHLRLHFRWLTRELLPASGQHERGEIEADNLDACSCYGNQHASRSTTKFEHRVPRLLCLLHEEGDIGPIPIGHNVVVKLRCKGVLRAIPWAIHGFLPGKTYCPPDGIRLSRPQSRSRHGL